MAQRVFEFFPEQKLMALVEKTVVRGVESDRLSLAEKRELASALEGLIRDYQELTRDEREDRALAAVLNRLGNTRYLLGDYGEAANSYSRAWKSLRNWATRAACPARCTSWQDGSSHRRLRRGPQALPAEPGNQQELGDKSGVARSLHQLGMLAQAHRRLRRGRKLYQQSLEIMQELGDNSGISARCTSWALAHLTGDYDEAGKLYQQSLEINQELGDKSGVSMSLHQLGMLAQPTGEYDEAGKLYQQSLEIMQELGDKSGMLSVAAPVGQSGPSLWRL